MSAHTCHAEDCTTRCPPRMLMCRLCWSKVPPDLQRAVLDAYRSGQERLNPMPSEAWLDAAFRAVNAVARSEGKPIPYPGLEPAAEVGQEG